MRLQLSKGRRALSSVPPTLLAGAFALVAALLFAALTTGLGMSRLEDAREEVLASSRREGRIATALLANELAAELARTSGGRPSSDVDVVVTLASLRRVLDDAATRLSRDTAIVKVKLFDRYGTIIYSTAPSEIGTVTATPASVTSALTGRITNTVSRRETFVSATGVLRDVDIVETYFPFAVSTVEPQAIIETYSNVTELLARVRARHSEEMRVISGTMLSAYLFLLLIVVWGVRKLNASAAAVSEHAARLDETSRFLNNGIESLTDGIAFWDPEDRLLKFNRRYLEILPHLRPHVRPGMTLAEINTVGFKALFPDLPDDEVARRVATRLAARREPGRVWTMNLPGGRIVEIVDHAMAGGSGYVTLFRDVTEAAQAAERLAASEARFRDAIESIGDGFVMFDQARKVALWNSRYVEILPFLRGVLHVGMDSRDVLAAIAASELYGIPPDARAAWVDANIDRMAPDRRHYRRELADGRVLEGSVHDTGRGGFALVLRDISEVRETQIALARSEQRFRDFASATADWFWEMDEQLRFTFLSESNYAITGMRPESFYATSPLELRPDGVTDEAWEAHLAQLRAHEPFKDFRFRTRGADGRVRTVSTSGRPFYDAEGRFKGYRGIGTDITPMVEAQQRAEASEALLRDGVEGMASGLIMFDDAQRVALWNSRYVAIFPYLDGVIRKGMPARELLTRHAESAVYGLAPEERHAWIESRMAHDPAYRDDILQPLADGRTLRIRGSSSRAGGEIYVVNDVSAEVGAQRRLERALAELRQSQGEVRRLALVAQHTASVVIITDATGHVEWVNDAFTRISGYGSAEIVGRRPGELLQGPDTDRATIADVRAALRRGEGFRVEILNYAKDGRPYWVEIDCSPVRDVEGNVERFIAVETDVTERKQQESRLAAALEREREVSLQQRRFVSIAAHEFRTPLTIIDGAAQRLTRYADQLSPEEIRDRARRIRGAVQRMSQLVDTTLNTARLDEGRIELNLGQVDVVALVTAICRRGDGFAPEFRFKIVSSAAALPIQADARLLEQVFTNLLSNAVKYSGASRQVDITIAGGAQGVTVAIRDYGIGVPESEVDQLFTRFFRASSAKGLPGTGIGLSLVRDLVRLHGGEVEVRSALGEGSTFTVRLPLSVDHARVATLAPAA